MSEQNTPPRPLHALGSAYLVLVQTHPSSNSIEIICDLTNLTEETSPTHPRTRLGILLLVQIHPPTTSIDMFCDEMTATHFQYTSRRR